MAQPTAFHINDLLHNRILERILEICFHEPAALPPSPTDPHIALSRVCSRWREIILATPAFWERIVFNPDPFTNDNGQLSTFRLYIQRSGSNPLSFYFRTKLEEHLRTNPQLVNLRVEDLVYGAGRFSIVQDIILPYIRRIQHLDCLIFQGENVEFLLNIPQGSFRILETVNVTFVNNFTTPTSTFTMQQHLNFRPFASLPHLREITCRIMNNIHPLDLKLPWARMTKLDFGGTVMSPELMMRIVDQLAHSLVDGYFYVEFDIRSTRLQGSLPITMPSLTQFRLLLINPSFYPDFVILFRLPALKKLWVERADNYLRFEWDLPRYISLLSHTMGSVEILTLCNFPIRRGSAMPHHLLPSRRQTSYWELEALLNTVPNVHDLCLPWSIHIHPPTFCRIATGKLLRRLQALELGTTNPELVFNMVRMRINTGSTFSTPPLTQITSLHLTLPSNDPAVESAVKEEAKSLHLPAGCSMTFIPPCKGCSAHCCFGK